MPKLSRQPPKYARHQSTNQAIVYLEGRVRYLGKYGSRESHARYQQLLAGWQATRDRPHHITTGRPFDACLSRFHMASCEGSVSVRIA